MSDQKYYIRKGNKAVGPLSRTRMEELHEQGILNSDSIVAMSAAGPWVRLDDMREVTQRKVVEQGGLNQIELPITDSKINVSTPERGVSIEENAKGGPPEILTRSAVSINEVVMEGKTPAIHPEPALGKSRFVPAILLGILVVQLLQVMKALGLGESIESTKWEYTVEAPSDIVLESSLDRLGSSGWEMVFARRATSELGPASYEMIFKRPKKD